MTLRIPLLLALAACGTSVGPNGSDSGTATGFTTTDALNPVAVQAPEAAAVWLIQWETQGPGASWVEFGLDGTLDRSTVATASSASHDIALMGLKAGRSYSWQAVTELDDGSEVRSPVQELQTAPPPPGLALPDLSVSESTSAATEGYIQYSQIQPNGESWMVIVDGEADLVWWQRGVPGTMIVTSRPSRDEHDVMYAEWDLLQQDDVASLYRVDLEGRARLTTILDKGHHDFYEHADGSFGFYGFEVDNTSWIASDAILEVAEGATTASSPERIWSYLDDYPHAPWVICEHMTAGWPRDDRFDEWTHSNSLLMDPAEEHYFVMSKFQDSLLKIRRSDGALIWQLNGLYGDFTMGSGGDAWSDVGDTQLWSHGHMSHVYEAPAGSGYDLCAAIFDNGMHYAPEASRAIEVCIDEAAMTADVTWSYDEPAGGFTPLMGDVRQLDDGWLVGWSGLGHIDEVSTTGDLMWSIQLPPGVSAGRVNYWKTLTP